MRAYFKEFIGQSEPVSVGKLKDYCSMQYGYTETATNEPIGSKFLRITDIAQSYIDWSAVPYCPITDDNHRLKLHTNIKHNVLFKTNDFLVLSIIGRELARILQSGYIVVND